MSDVQTDINESQAVQTALTATVETQAAVVASIATPGNDPLAAQPVAVAGNGEPITQPAIPVLTDVLPTVDQPISDPGHAHTLNTGADIAEAAALFKAPVDGQTLTTGVQVQTNHAPLVKAELPSTLGAKQAGNAMDTMHGKVNATWPPKAR